MKSGCSTAGCHGERDELGDASRETSPTVTVLTNYCWTLDGTGNQLRLLVYGGAVVPQWEVSLSASLKT